MIRSNLVDQYKIFVLNLWIIKLMTDFNKKSVNNQIKDKF